MLIQIGDVELRFSRMTIAYKCGVLLLTLLALAYGATQKFHSGGDRAASFQSEP